MTFLGKKAQPKNLILEESSTKKNCKKKNLGKGLIEKGAI